MACREWKSNLGWLNGGIAYNDTKDFLDVTVIYSNLTNLTISDNGDKQGENDSITKKQMVDSSCKPTNVLKFLTLE